jgi:hypothetical protein
MASLQDQGLGVLPLNPLRSVHLLDRQIHDFPLAADILPEGRRGIRYIGDFVKEITAEGEIAAAG